MTTIAGPLIAATIGLAGVYWSSRRTLSRHGQMTAVKTDLDVAAALLAIDPDDAFAKTMADNARLRAQAILYTEMRPSLYWLDRVGNWVSFFMAAFVAVLSTSLVVGPFLRDDVSTEWPGFIVAGLAYGFVAAVIARVVRDSRQKKPVLRGIDLSTAMAFREPSTAMFGRLIRTMPPSMSLPPQEWAERAGLAASISSDVAPDVGRPEGGA
ncbi:hypothetical protein FK268_09405 [Tsukamurella sputi]|uniref:Uncharacterized protein n=1 Tax=Tsukamurella sputi TaxID=2591848 RepID=A0A5C5RTJ8_9ACTN|nr:hypothetical protein [Tsukamurella sputi]TWS25395.1 hypothetical protein FK268_09405 [Tsukamurella sputi]